MTTFTRPFPRRTEQLFIRQTTMPVSLEHRAALTATLPLMAIHIQEIAVSFYHTLFLEYPSFKNMFNHSALVRLQPDAIAAAIYSYITNMDDVTRIESVLEKVSHKHASLGVKTEHFDIYRDGLLRAFRRVLGADIFTPDVSSAYSAAYDNLAGILCRRQQTIIAEQQVKSHGWEGWRDMRIVKRVEECDDVCSLYLKPQDGGNLPLFLPGQYISLRVSIPDTDTFQTRQFSLIDPPSHHGGQDTTYRVAIQKFQNCQPEHHVFIGTTIYETCHKDDAISVSQPTGNFHLDVEDIDELTPIVLISAGAGMTSLMSISQSLIQQSTSIHETLSNHVSGTTQQRSITWIHSARNSKHNPFVSQLLSIPETHNNLQTLIYHTQPLESEKLGNDYDVQGRMNLLDFDNNQRQRLLHVDNSQTLYYVCGSDRFMLKVSEGLDQMGIDFARQKLERIDVGSVRA